MKDKTVIIVVMYVATILMMKRYVKTIGSYDLLNMFFGATLFCVFNALKILYLKKPFKFEDVMLTAFVLFSSNYVKRIIMAWIYPKADKNKDGLVTEREFYEWKHKIENKIENELDKKIK